MPEGDLIVTVTREVTYVVSDLNIPKRHLDDLEEWASKKWENETFVDSTEESEITDVEFEEYE